MSDAFANFAEAAAKRPTPEHDAPTRYGRVAVLGGGADARLLAALCLSEGAEVTLFSAYGDELEAMRASSGVALRGAGPVGTYQVDRQDAPSIQLTAELDRAVRGAEVIFLTGPIHKQRTYAMVLADHLSDQQVLVLPNARSLGALETAWLLRIGGAQSDVTLVELQGLPFWIDQQAAVLTLAERQNIPAATLPSGREAVIAALGALIPGLSAQESVLASGFADGSAIVEFPALLMGGPALAPGVADIPMGGQVLAENVSFANLIGAEQRALIAGLAAERHAVAKGFGIRNLPSGDAWIEAHAGAPKGEARRGVPTQAEAKALLRDGVIGSLTPLVSAAALGGVDAPLTQSMIALGSSVLGADVSAAGRRLDTIGVRATDLESARSVMDKIALGAR